MPRQSRRKSEFGYMHVIARGVARQTIFEDVSDYKYYLIKLKNYCMETDVKVCAYCLMNNHVHLLLHGDSTSISQLMKKLGISYSYYFNKKYNRVGHLFQDRFKSEPVEDNVYLLTVFRYILQNPQKAGICDTTKYRWSSYMFYDSKSDYMDLTLIKALLGSRSVYENFVKAGNDEQCLDFDTSKHDDKWAIEEIGRRLGISSGFVLLSYDKEKRNMAIRELMKCGLSKRQIERLCGISRGVINKVELSA